MTSRLFTAALRAVPSHWRDAVKSDLEEDALAEGRGALWCAAQALGLAIELRWRTGGDMIFATLQQAWRSLRATPSFTLGAMITFALGIGLNLAVFSAVDRVLFRTLPYHQPDRLVLIRSCNADTGECSGTIPAAVAFAIQQQSGTMASIAVAGFSGAGFALSRDPDAPRLRLAGVSPGVLRTLGVAPRIGHDLSDEDIRSRTRAVWLSEQTWRSKFGADPGVVGRGVWAGTAPIVIFGVLPADFIPPTGGGTDPDWEGLVASYEGWTEIGPTGRVLVPFARLKDGATMAAARDEVNALVRALPPARPGAPPERVQVDGIDGGLFSLFRSYLWLVVTAAGLVLAMACANLASLFLARGRSREHQAAIATALGASPARILATTLTEGLLVCTGGVVTALGVLALSLRGIDSLLPPIFSRYSTGVGDTRLIVVALIVSCVGALAAAVAPGRRLARVDVLSVLQQTGRGPGRGKRVGGRSLLIFEAAVGAVLVLGAVLAVRSFASLTRDPLGFDPDDVSAITVGRAARVPPPEQIDLYRRALALARQTPGVVAAGGVDSLPTMGEGAPGLLGPGEAGAVGRYEVTAGYFEAMRTLPIAGRLMTDAEIDARADVMNLTRSAVRLLWPDATPASAVGRTWQSATESPKEVVGVIDDQKGSYGDTRSRGAAYLPAGPAPSPMWRYFVVRMQSGTTLDVAGLRNRFASKLGDVRTTVTPLSNRIEPGLRDPRFRSILLSVFALTALLLAVVGLYSVASYDMTVRRYEMGVRIAVGATPADLRRLVIAEVVGPVALGIVIGLGASWWLSRFAERFLFQIEARDPLTYVVVVVVLLLAAMVSAWLPARRAATVDPVVELRGV